MAVLTIRAHKRYATRQQVRLRAGRAKPVSALLIELSSEGIRLSNLGSAEFEPGQQVSIEIGECNYTGRVRWSHDGLAGIRLESPLHRPEIARLLEFGRRAALELVRQVA